MADAGADSLTGFGASTSGARRSRTARCPTPSASTSPAPPRASRACTRWRADYAAGEEAIAGFKKGFEEGGGKLLGETKTPFGTTQDFQPFLAKARKGEAQAPCSCVLRRRRGGLVRQAVQGIRGSPSSAPAVRIGLPHRGRRAEGPGQRGREASRPTLHYAHGLDNTGEQEPSPQAYQAKAGGPATVYAMQTWDAAAVLDRGRRRPPARSTATP